MKLDGKVALVTGGSRGIGRAIALLLAERGAKVVINYNRNQTEADAVVAAVEAKGGQALAVQGDVSVAAQAQALVDQTIKAFGRIDILVNNAGITKDTLMMRMSETDWDAVVDTNLKGAFLCAKAALRPMLKSKGGRIINISSISGQAGSGGQANYSAAKAGMIGFTKALAREVGSRGITVNAIAPGFIETDMTNVLAEEFKQKALAQIPLERFGKPEDIAEAVAFLASDAGNYITGQVLAVNGGMVMM
ncbi:MAG: 3-oxoacyl-[acyl-carrier-protein] reductase [Chloroflexi bacterium]|jgi:3-oxoacyl-[acyl-carrier protein] reductase|nr:3-oxoacyl-[acyl-carrier-protein] reductase [Chloroflexota bacterium]